MTPDIKAIRNRVDLGRPTRITEVKALLAEIERLNAELAQAVECINQYIGCFACWYYESCVCINEVECDGYSQFEYRGLRKE